MVADEQMCHVLETSLEHVQRDLDREKSDVKQFQMGEITEAKLLESLAALSVTCGVVPSCMSVVRRHSMPLGPMAAEAERRRAGKRDRAHAEHTTAVAELMKLQARRVEESVR